MLSHAAALTYGTGAVEAQGYRSSDVFYVCLPLFHNNALLAAVAAALVAGASVVLSLFASLRRHAGMGHRPGPARAHATRVSARIGSAPAPQRATL